MYTVCVCVYSLNVHLLANRYIFESRFPTMAFENVKLLLSTGSLMFQLRVFIWQSWGVEGSISTSDEWGKKVSTGINKNVDQTLIKEHFRPEDCRVVVC